MNDGNQIIIIYQVLNNLVRTISINRVVCMPLHRKLFVKTESYGIKMEIVR